MTQTKSDLEDWYQDKDPWFYATTPDDVKRKQIIIHTCNLFGPFSRALDIGAGEGWVTADLPASTKHGVEISDIAAARFPERVTRVLVPQGQYDLVLATGVIYQQYDWRGMVRMIKDHACKIVVTSHIASWELLAVMEIGKQVLEMKFPYRQFDQRLRVFDVSASPHRP